MDSYHNSWVIPKKQTVDDGVGVEETLQYFLKIETISRILTLTLLSLSNSRQKKDIHMTHRNWKFEP